MKKPPCMITPKDLSYLDDLLSHIHVYCKKTKHYLDLVKNKEVGKQLQEVHKLLYSQYDELLNILEV